MREGIEHFGGAPHKIIFDNARVAVKEGFGAYAKATDKYSAMAAHYAFRPVFCNVASGHEKGLVEGLVGFVRRNTLVPVPQVDSLDELNQLFDDKARAYLEHVIDGKKESVGVRGETARAGLIVLPPYRFDTTKTSVVKADDFSLVRFDSNRYSVPVRYAGREVTVKGSGNSVRIIFKGEDIAVWERDYSRGAVHYRLEHYIELLERKPRSIYNAEPVRQTVPKELMSFMERLNDPHELVGTLKLYMSYGNNVIEKLQTAHTYPALEACFNESIAESVNNDALSMNEKLPDITICLPSLDRYDSLVRGGALNE